MGVIFAKTAKGHKEIATRPSQLTPRQRRVLIMVDGKRNVAELREMLQNEDLQHTLGLLEEEGYIAVAGLRQQPDAPLQPIPPEGLPSITAFRPLPASPNPQELEMARNFIINSLRNLHGHYANIGIIDQATAARTHEELRQQFDPWMHAVMQSREGKRRAEELREKLLKVL